MRCAGRTIVGVPRRASVACTVHTYLPGLRPQANEMLESAPDGTLWATTNVLTGAPPAPLMTIFTVTRGLPAPSMR